MHQGALVAGMLALAAIGPACARSSENADCAKADARLRRLASAADPAQTARAEGLVYRDGRVRVVVELVDAGTPFPADAGAQVEGRAGARVQALLPLDRLCALARDPSVRAVAPPLSPVAN